ncbi:TPA: AMP phosphorylase [Candidatus Woesearchaeota archaeon]|nr:AMP phosphorylase [Candidatus Woesearchaeota archaeon]HII68641.1 AMP phosphorylase [Candidatus Woesearchaeota archaeon]
MKLKVRDIDISTGGVLVVAVNEHDARKIDLHHLDRVKIRRGSREETAVVDIAYGRKTVPDGHIGAFEEVISSLRLRNGETVQLIPARKPLSLQFIRKKLDGLTLTRKEIEQIVWDIVHNKLSNIELTYFVAACYTNAMSTQETVMLAKAIAEQGDILSFGKRKVLDKHCIGGVPGNRTTLVLVPILAAAGFLFPKTSSRSITSPAGTADTMEVLCPVSFPIPKLRSVVRKVGACMVWGGALNLAPADDKIIQVEKPLAIDAESQLIASIMAKKYSAGSTHILLDIPISAGGKIRSRAAAEKLKKKFLLIGKALGKKVDVYISDGSQPIGNGIGPCLEARDVLKIFRRDADRPMDLEEKCLDMADRLFALAGVAGGRKRAKRILDSGKAYVKFREIIKAQGGKPTITPDNIAVGRYTHTYHAKKSGKVAAISNEEISRIARIAGAPADKGAGMYLYHHVGCRVKEGDKLFTLYAQAKHKLAYAVEMISEDCVEVR